MSRSRKPELLLLVALSALLAWAWRSELLVPIAPEWEASWKEPLTFSARGGGADGYTLTIERDRYRLRHLTCSYDRLEGCGAIELVEDRLRLISSAGTRSFRLWGTRGHWILMGEPALDGAELRFTQWRREIPRLNPPDSLPAHAVLSINHIRLGMDMEEVANWGPWETLGPSGRCMLLNEGTDQQTQVWFDPTRRAECVEGTRLEVDGQPALNGASSADDLDWIEGLSWVTDRSEAPAVVQATRLGNQELLVTTQDYGPVVCPGREDIDITRIRLRRVP